ncbi:MAG: protein-L-isoaspartate(D-aspartate) O-methyltransferase [Nitrospiraceae bacterium]|nr:protein-L-isoaspartate(D-aspartate) O-methyltransferase [Nitrospiraceae bacterium]
MYLTDGHYRELAQEMVRSQLAARGIHDKKVLDAMADVPRHEFLPEAERKMAYEDMALPIGEGQTMSQPYMVAVMTQLLDLHGNEKVLEIGTGSGYQAAVLSVLASEVFTIEIVPDLAGRARLDLQRLGYGNVTALMADGTIGLPEKAPFDRIIVTAATPSVPEPLTEQLAEGGVLVAPVGDRWSQTLVRIIKTREGLQQTLHTKCVFVPLLGKYGWQE